MSMQERPYLSIGEVLGLLLEEFPDVTISKIRFLESQGLIDPERTASGYRKFYDNDVDLLRVILREQRENFLPLRVIRDRLESGAIEDPTGPTTPPRGVRNDESVMGSDDGNEHEDRTRGAVATDTSTPTQRHAIIADEMDRPAPPPAASVAALEAPPVAHYTGGASADPTSQSHRHDSFAAADLCRLAGLTEAQLAELESYGLVNGKGSGPATTYTACDLAIAQAAAGFMQHGVEGRHLKAARLHLRSSSCWW